LPILEKYISSVGMASSLWAWMKLPFYFGSGLVSLGGGALYYWQKYADEIDDLQGHY